MADSRTKEKERAAQLKALREELESQIERDLAESPVKFEPRLSPADGPVTGDVSPKRTLEALLFASSKPLTVGEIRKVFVGAGFPRPLEGDEGKGRGDLVAPTTKQIEGWIGELKEEYNREGRSFEVVEIAGGFQIVTRKAYAVWLARLEFQKRVRQASRSALETLAILAYKQPVTRAEIEEIRGVDISAVLSTLLERGFIRIVGKKEVPGRPFLYGTTEKFLEHFGLKSLTDLPEIGEIKTLVERAVRKEEWIGEGTSGATPSDKGEETVPTQPEHESERPASEN